MSLLEVLLFASVAICGAAVVFTKRPIHQLFVYSVFGGMLALLFFVLQAPDVALSETAIGGIAVPLMVLVAIMKTGNIN